MNPEIFNKTGLRPSDLEKLDTVFRKYDEIDEVILYGSRAKGTFRQYSDVDITLKGSRLTIPIMNRLSLEIDDLLLPYNFDISIFSMLTNRDLTEHIVRVGIPIYSTNRP